MWVKGLPSDTFGVVSNCSELVGILERGDIYCSFVIDVDETLFSSLPSERWSEYLRRIRKEPSVFSNLYSKFHLGDMWAFTIRIHEWKN